MISFLRPRVASRKVTADQVQPFYKRSRVQALIAVFVGYAAFYIVRNNFTFSTPYLEQNLGMDKTTIGLLSSIMLISYGCSKGVMSSLADKASPKYFMALGLILCAVANFFLGLSDFFWMIAICVLFNGIFQGMGVAPSFITLANWFPRKERGRAGAIWNISHNLGGGIVAPIVTGGFIALAFFMGSEAKDGNWHIACYWIPAGVAALVAIFVLFMGKESPVNEGLPPLGEIVPDDKELVKEAPSAEVANMSSFQIFKKYVLPNKHAWFVSFVDVFVYMIRFGVLAWLPIYLEEVKHFSKGEMSIAFLCFEWAAIPSTLLAGWLSDKLFHGRRMPLAIIAMLLIFFCIIGYWQSTSLVAVTFFAAIVGCLIYIPQFLSSVQTMEVVPSFAVGSAVGLRGFMSYILGASLGTSLMGFIVQHTKSWDIGFMMLLGGVVCCIIFAFLSDRGAMELARQREAEEAARQSA